MNINKAIFEVLGVVLFGGFYFFMAFTNHRFGSPWEIFFSSIIIILAGYVGYIIGAVIYNMIYKPKKDNAV